MQQKNKPIGIFDSGLGGLTVAKSIMELLPDEQIIYFGDTAHVPYGNRSESQIKGYVIDDVKFLKQFDIKAVVIACNTADSVASQVVSQLFDFPVYGVIEPTSRIAVEATRNQKIGVIATNATVNSQAYVKTIQRLSTTAQVFQQSCPLLVPLVENGRYRQGDGVIETVLSEYLLPLKQAGIDTLILGCTHYPLLQDLISVILPNVTLISSSNAAAENLAQQLQLAGLLNTDAKKPNQFFVSDNPVNFQKQAEIFMKDNLESPIQLASNQ